MTDNVIVLHNFESYISKIKRISLDTIIMRASLFNKNTFLANSRITVNINHFQEIFHSVSAKIKPLKLFQWKLFIDDFAEQK